MKISRGIVNLKFKDIDPYFKGEGGFNSYGSGTSYAKNLELAKTYASEISASFGYILTYRASNVNTFKINEDAFLEQSDDDFMEDGFYLLKVKDKEIKSNELSSLISKDGNYNCIDIQEMEDDSTSQIFVLDESLNLELESCLFYVSPEYDSKEILKIEGVKESDDIFFYNVPLSKIKEIDNYILKYIN